MLCACLPLPAIIAIRRPVAVLVLSLAAAFRRARAGRGKSVRLQSLAFERTDKRERLPASASTEVERP